MSFYRRNLPHWQPEQAEYFVTFRLVNSLPKSAITRLQNERERLKNPGENPDQIRLKTFKKYEQLLDNLSSGSIWLNNDSVARIVCDALHYRDETEYDLYAYCVMPNHVHTVFRLLDFNNKIDYPVTELLGRLKRFTASECSQVLEREGQFWQHESFDHVIRDNEELENMINYVLYNPVKAGLVKNWKEWPHSYCKPEFLKT